MSTEPYLWIKKNFIKHITEECPDNMDDADFLAEAFCVSERDISVYKATSNFTLPGCFLEGGIHSDVGMPTRRTVKKRDILVVRRVDNIKSVQVEWLGSVFSLTESEWRKVCLTAEPTKGNIAICTDKPRQP